MAFWGRAAQGGFDGREGTFSLDGTVTHGHAGRGTMRAASGWWGLALAQSEGEGDYRDSDVSPRPDGQSCPDGVDSGLLQRSRARGATAVWEASLTAAIPLCGVAGLGASEALGRGGLRHRRGDAEDGARRELQVRYHLEHGGGRAPGRPSGRLPPPDRGPGQAPGPARRWR